MPEPTKKHHTETNKVTIRLCVRKENVAKIKAYAKSIEEGNERNFTVDEVFSQLVGKEKTIALRGYRNREDLTQRQLATLTGIPQRHISEMENGKRPLGKENAKKMGQALNVDYRLLL